MEDDEKLSYRRLHNRNYRSLQQLAKSLDLPSNFKKMYLIELIQAKKFKSQTEVDNIIHRVKLERLQLSREKRESRRRKLQYTEQPSTSKTYSSPQITQTPKRPGHLYIPYTEEQKSLLTYNPKRNLMQNLNQNPLPSDRVLRSFNMKTVKPNYVLLSGQDIKPQANSRETRIKIVANGGFPQFNVTAKCVVKKHKPNILHNSLKRPLMLTQGPDLVQNASKRQRTLSGIYPIMPETIPRDLHSTESVCLRKMDGSVTKINALVQKRNMDLMPRPKNNYRNAEINIQDVVNSMEDTFTDNLLAEPSNNNYIQIEYPNMSSIDNVNCNLNPQMSIGSSVNENLDMYSVYYHKKIRSEQIRCQKLREIQESDKLPRINDVFSKFNNVHRIDLTQPLYVQVSTESERSQSHPLYTNREQYNTIMLETVYNFKNEMLTNAPLLQIATTATTKVVYATPTVTTAIAQPSTIVSNDYIPSVEMDDHRQSDMDPRLYEFLQFSEQNPRRNYYQNEDFNTSTSTTSLDTSQDLSSATIPEMVEDALEIISQDGDYMESIAMDIRVQCILCSWAGPRMILENHIRKEHAGDIVSVQSARWRVALAAGGARVLRHGAALYVLRARAPAPAPAPAYVLLTLTSLSTEEEPKLGSITVYNRLSGEPFTWSGHIQPYFQCDSENCLKVELSRLNLLPNSANVKLVNRELVSESPNKVIVGQSMLNEIQMVLYVKIFN